MSKDNPKGVTSGVASLLAEVLPGAAPEIRKDEEAAMAQEHLRDTTLDDALKQVSPVDRRTDKNQV